MDQAIVDAVEHQRPGDIGSGAKVGGVSEAHHPAVTEDEVQTHGEDRENDDARTEDERVIVTGRRQGEQRNGHNERDDVVPVH